MFTEFIILIAILIYYEKFGSIALQAQFKPTFIYFYLNYFSKILKNGNFKYR